MPEYAAARNLAAVTRPLQAGAALDAKVVARMARELNLLSEESAVYLARLQVDLGTQVGAWRKASVAMASASAFSAIQPT